MSIRIDWYYHRNGCRTCQRADAHLQQAGAAIVEQVDARKHRIAPAEAIELVQTADHLWVARGKRFLYFNLKQQRPTDAELKKLLIGPSGNLRAPTIRRGKKIFVGFHPEGYDQGFLA